MTRRDFEVIADLIAGIDFLTIEQKTSLAAEFCIVLEKNYPRFDPIPFCKRALAGTQEEHPENVPADPSVSPYFH